MEKGAKYQNKIELMAAWDDYCVNKFASNSTVVKKSNAVQFVMRCLCKRDDCCLLRASQRNGVWIVGGISPKLPHCTAERQRNIHSKIISSNNVVVGNKVPGQKQSGKGARKEAAAFVQSAAGLGGTDMRKKAAQSFLNDVLGDNLEDHGNE